MKRTCLLAALLLLVAGVTYAQKYAFVNTETVFKAIPEYNRVIEQLDEQARQQQQEIDADYAQIAEMYDRYQDQEDNLSESGRKQVEDNIIRLEKAAGEKQKRYFGPEGELMKKRLELLKPIQDRVFGRLDALAQSRGYDMVVDISNNPSVVYYNKSLDLSRELMQALGIRE